MPRFVLPSLVIVALGSGCGRFSFEEHRSDDIDAPAIDGVAIDGVAIDADPDPIVDAAPDAMLVPWTLEFSDGQDDGPATLEVTNSSTLIVVAIQIASAATVTAVTDNANPSNVYTRIPQAACVTGGEAIDVWYATMPRPGATQLAIAGPSASELLASVAWVAGGTPLVLDQANAISSAPSSMIVSSPPTTTTQPGEFLVAATVVAHVVVQQTAGSLFTRDASVRSNGWSHLESNAAPAGSYQAQWDQNIEGTYCATTVAFHR